MPETVTPSARVHRVTTRRRTLRPLSCPLEPELLIAEFADELPPEVAAAVREHVALCEVCSAHSLELKGPYQLLASLGQEPVGTIPDLRDPVRARARAHPALRAVRGMASTVGRNGMVGLTAILGLGLLVFFIAVVLLLPANAQTIGRSSNQLQHVPAAGASGVLYAETGKLVTVTDRSGRQWQVGEIIATSEKTGVVIRSLPNSQAPLHLGTPRLMPVAVQVVDGTVAELTARASDGAQALVVFDARTGQVRSITRITLPGKKPLPGAADALAMAPDAQTAYVGIAQDAPTQAGVRVVIIDVRTGTIAGTLAPGFDATVPLPPPPGSLPASGFPGSVPHLDAGGMAISQGLNGALVVSPDGQWLFDVVILSKGGSEQYAVVRRFSAQTGVVAQELGLSGAFPNAQLAVNTSAHSPQIYLVRGSPTAEAFIMDASAGGPTLIGDVPLGGPVAAANVSFLGSLTIAPSADGTKLYIGQDVRRSDGQTGGHDLWVVDTQGMDLIAHRSDPTAAGALLQNPAGTGMSAAFLLRDGEVNLIQSNLAGRAVPWLRLSDGHSVVALLAVAQS